MDDVIFQYNNFWLQLHKKFNTLEKGVELAKRYLKTDYARLVDEVAGKLWKGKKADAYFELVNESKYIQILNYL